MVMEPMRAVSPDFRADAGTLTANSAIRTLLVFGGVQPNMTKNSPGTVVLI
jgi:hypothetical protein